MEWLADNFLGPLLVTVAGVLIAAFNWRRLRNWFRHSDLRPPDPSHFTILVADLDGDTDGRQTGHVVRALEGQEGIRVIRDGRRLKIEEVGDRAENLAAAMERGRRWLSEKNAEVLIWGESTDANKVLHLRLLGEGGSGDGATAGYALGDTYDLPEDFGRDFGEVLVAVALAAVRPATELQGHYVVHLLEPVASKLERLLASPPQGFSPEQLATVQVAFGIAASILGEQSGKSDWLEKSVVSFQAALEVRRRDALPLDWAKTQNNLGNALLRLGEREEGTARLVEAVSAYRSALEVRSREALPLAWATTQNNLGNALQSLGEREEGTARLDEAVSAFRAALEVYSRDALPLAWAMTQNNLGNALSRLGDQVY